MVDVSVRTAKATVSPEVKATVSDNAVLKAAAGVTITADHGQAAPEFSDGKFNAATKVDTSANTIDFT